MPHTRLEVACRDPVRVKEEENEPRSPTLSAFFRHLAAEDDLVLDDIFSNSSDQFGTAELDELAALGTTRCSIPSACSSAEDGRPSSADMQQHRSSPTTQQHDDLGHSPSRSQLDLPCSIRAASRFEAAGDTAAGAVAAAGGSVCDAAVEVAFRRASEAGQSALLSRQTSNSSVMTVADCSLFVPVSDSHAPLSTRLDALQCFVAPAAVPASPAMPPATPAMAAAACNLPLARSSSLCSSLCGSSSLHAPVRTLRLPTLLPPFMLHRSSAAGACLGPSSSMLPPALLQAMGLAAPAATLASPAAGLPAQLPRAGSAPAPLALPGLSSAGFTAGAACAGAPAAGAAARAAARALSTAFAGAAGSAGDTPRPCAGPCSAPLHTSTSMEAGTGAALHARSLLRSNSSTKSSLASAHNFVQQLPEPADSKVPAHASSPMLAPAASASLGAGSAAAAWPTVKAEEPITPAGAAAEALAAAAAPASKGSMSPPPAKKPRAARRAGSKARKPAQAASGSCQDASAAVGVPAASAPATPAVAPSAPAAAGGRKAAAAAGSSKPKRKAAASAAPSATTGAGSSSKADEEQSGPKRRKGSRVSGVPKHVRDLAEIKEQIRLMTHNNSHLSAQLSELSSIKAQLQRRLAGMYASWTALEADNVRLRDDNAEMQQVMAPFMHLLLPAQGGQLPAQEDQLAVQEEQAPHGGVELGCAAAGADGAAEIGV